MDKVERVKNVVCYVGKISKKDLLSKKRDRFIVDNRRIAFVICRDILEMGWSQIGRAFKLNHATIMHNYTKHLHLLEYDDYYRNRYNDILEVFKMQIDYIEPRELIKEVVNIKKQRYNNYLKQLIKNNNNEINTETASFKPFENS